MLSLAGGRLFFQKVYGVQGDDLSELLSYFYPTAFTVIQNMLVFQYSAYFRNCLNTRITLYSTIVSTGVNLFFDFSLVHGVFGLPRLGTAGAAWGSVIGLAAGLLIYQSVYWKKQFSLSMYSVTALLRALKQQSVSAAAKNTAWEILRLYPSLLGQELIENTIFACVITAAIARLGTEQMAIYSLLDTVGSTIGLPIYAYASATQTFALQRYSARDPASARRYLRSGMLLAFGAVTFLCALCGIFSKPLLLLVVDDLRIVTRTRTFLPFVFLLLLARIIQQIPMSCLQGIGREKFVLLCTTIGTAGASIGILTMGNLAGLTGLYLVMTTELTMLGICYLRQISK